MSVNNITRRNLTPVRPSSGNDFFSKLGRKDGEKVYLPSGEDDEIGVSNLDGDKYHVVLKSFMSAADKAQRDSYLYNIKAKGYDLTKANASMQVGMFGLATAIVVIKSWNLEDPQVPGRPLPITQETVGKLPEADLQAIVDAYNKSVAPTEAQELEEAKNSLESSLNNTTPEAEPLED